MRLVFVNRFFFPDHSATSQMLADLAFGLSARGHSVAVVTSRLDYEDPTVRLAARERVHGVDIERIATTGFGRSRLAGRALDYLTFYLSAFWRLGRLIRRGDAVIVMTDPPMLSAVAAPAAWLRGGRVVNWLQDIFPEVATTVGIGRGGWKRWFFQSLRHIRDMTLRRAAINVVIGERMAEHIRRCGVADSRIVHIPNWADGQLVVPLDPGKNGLRRAWGLEDAFVVGYSGNLGRAHDHATIRDAMARVEERSAAPGMATGRAQEPATAPASRKDKPIRWLFIGGGAGMDRLRAELGEQGSASAQFHPYQPREVLAESLSVPDVHLISLRPELEGLIVPSKYYGIAAAGRPAIFIGDPAGEIGRILIASESGEVVAQGDGDGLAAAVLRLARDPVGAAERGRRARALLESAYDLTIALAAWERTLARLSAEPDR